MLSILNPEPVINHPFLEFHSRVKCDPLISILIDKPNTREYSAFVNELKQRARQAYNDFAGLKSESSTDILAGNVYDEPPEFDDDPNRKVTRNVEVGKVESAIQMLEQYLNADDIKPVLSALQALAEEPSNRSCLDQLIKAFDTLGPLQGAVLTYAPYVSLLLSDETPRNQ